MDLEEVEVRSVCHGKMPKTIGPVKTHKNKAADGSFWISDSNPNLPNSIEYASSTMMASSRSSKGPNTIISFEKESALQKAKQKARLERKNAIQGARYLLTVTMYSRVTKERS